MVRTNDLRQLIGHKVQDFAFVGKNKKFSVVFENHKALQFEHDPVAIEDVEEVREKEEPKKEKKPILPRINNFLSNVLKIFKIIFKVALILLIILAVFFIVYHWPDIKEVAINGWEAVRTWTGTP